MFIRFVMIGSIPRQSDCIMAYVTCWRAGVDSVWKQDSVRVWKMLETAAESRQSGARFVGWFNSSTSGSDCACTLVIHDNDAIRGDFAFRYLERHRDRAIGK
jgi:hypothetical protein